MHNRKLPAVEIAKQRICAVFNRDALVESVFSSLILIILLLIAWYFADLNRSQLLFLFLSGGLAILAVRNWRLFALQQKIGKAIGESTDKQTRLFEAKKTVAKGLLTSIGSLMLLFWLIIGATTDPYRVWIVVMCFIIQVALSNINVKSKAPPKEFYSLAKMARESGFRIVVFRPFTPRASSLARNTLIPVLAGYGSVEIVIDTTLEKVHPKGYLGRGYRDIEEFAHVHSYSNEKWREGVSKVIESADLAVIDISRPRPNVAWEMAKCYEVLPPHRIYCAVDAKIISKSGTLIDHIKRIYNEIELDKSTKFPHNIRPYSFLFWPRRGIELAFANDIHKKMCEIVGIEIGTIIQPVYYDDKLQHVEREIAEKVFSEVISSHPMRVEEAHKGIEQGGIDCQQLRTYNLKGCGAFLGCFGVIILIIALYYLAKTFLF